MKGNDKVKWIGCSTKQLTDALEEALAMFQLNLSFRYEMTTEGIFELVPMYIFRVNMSCYVSGPPVSCYASQLMSSIEYLLSVRTLRYRQLAFHNLQPVISIQGL